MRPFAYQRATDAASGVQALAAGAAIENTPLTEATVQPLAGGTTLIDLMKLDVMRPSTVVDINPLAGEWSMIDFKDGNLRLGALARMSDVAADSGVLRNYPVVADALKLAASPSFAIWRPLAAMSCSASGAAISGMSAMAIATSAIRDRVVQRSKDSTAAMRCRTPKTMKEIR
jgi:FAD binding domain in molybdopterin dehydrogenase